MHIIQFLVYIFVQLLVYVNIDNIQQKMYIIITEREKQREVNKMMTIEEAFRKILNTEGMDIEGMAYLGYSYEYEVEINGIYRTMNDDEVIALAETL